MLEKVCRMDSYCKPVGPEKPVGFHAIPLTATVPPEPEASPCGAPSRLGLRSSRQRMDDDAVELEHARRQLGLCPSLKKPQGSGLLGWLKKKVG